MQLLRQAQEPLVMTRWKVEITSSSLRLAQVTSRDEGFKSPLEGSTPRMRREGCWKGLGVRPNTLRLASLCSAIHLPQGRTISFFHYLINKTSLRAERSNLPNKGWKVEITSSSLRRAQGTSRDDGFKSPLVP